MQLYPSAVALVATSSLTSRGQHAIGYQGTGMPNNQNNLAQGSAHLSQKLLNSRTSNRNSHNGNQMAFNDIQTMNQFVAGA